MSKTHLQSDCRYLQHGDPNLSSSPTVESTTHGQCAEYHQSHHLFVTHLEEATALTRKLPSAQPRFSYLWPFKALEAHLILQRDL